MLITSGAWAQQSNQQGSPLVRPQMPVQPTKQEKLPLPPKPAKNNDASGDARVVADKDASGNSYVSGELIVTYEQDASEAEEQQTREAVGASLDDPPPGLPKVDAEVLPFSGAEDEDGKKARETRPAQKQAQLERDPDADSVSYNYLSEPNFTPNDPYFTGGYQWDLTKIGSTRAWDKTTGYGSTVAVLDTGFYTGHPDLRSKIVWQWDFFSGDSSANVDYGLAATSHGTHVAGTVAASTNNGTGVAGTAPSSQIMAAKVCGRTSVGDTKDDVSGYAIRCSSSAVINALNYFAKYASSSGIDVANLSLGGYGYSSAYEAAVNNAWNNGMVVVAAAGNDNTSAAHYPSAFTNAISVAATDHLDRKAPYSNYRYVDVAAPGGNMYYSGGGILSTIATGTGYGYIEGTSMAAPHVSGLAAMLASQGLNNAQIRYQIEHTAVDLGTQGWDQYYGYGRINALSAVSWY